METELKFEMDAAAAGQLSRRLGLASRGKTRSLRSVYFDTADSRLLAEGVALRVRHDGRRFVQTVKTAGGQFHRGEWETEVDGPEPDLDAAEDTPLGRALAACEVGSVRPAFETRVERATRNITVGAAVVEAALDRGVVEAGGADSPILELELELKKGETGALFELARELAQVAPMHLSFASKARRGYAMVEGAPLAPVRASDPILSAKDDAQSAFKAIAGAALAQIADNARVLRHVRRIEALHQLRVGVRRLRSALSLFRPMLEDGSLEGVKAELTWLTHELDEARNLDVFIADTFRPAAKRHASWAGLAALGRALISAQTRAYDRAEAALASERFRTLMLETAAWIETGPWTQADGVAQKMLRTRPILATARDILENRRRKVAKAGRDLESLEPLARHKVRIAAKKLRYATGFFCSLYSGKSAKRLRAFVGAMESLQDGLGAVTDIAAANALTATLASATTDEGDVAASFAFAAGLVAGERQRDADKALKRADRAMKRFRRAVRFW